MSDRTADRSEVDPDDADPADADPDDTPTSEDEPVGIGAAGSAASALFGRHHLRLHIQLTRFVITGGLAAIVDFGLLNLLMFAGLGHNPAKAISFVAGTTTAYLINRRWTFRAAPSARRFLAVVVLYLITFALQVGLWALLYPTLHGAGLPEVWVRIIGFVIAQGVATTVNFLVQRLVIFRPRH